MKPRRQALFVPLGDTRVSQQALDRAVLVRPSDLIDALHEHFSDDVHRRLLVATEAVQ